MIRSLLLFAFLGILAAYLYRIISSLDLNKRVYNHRPGSCRKVEGIAHGSEDIALVEEEGIAFVTSGVLYMIPRGKDVKGQIFLYDFNQKGTWNAEPLKINGKFDQDNFHPHGISHVVTSAGTIRLFVINHSNAFHHSVMVFDWNRKTRQLDFVRIVKDEKFIRPNDLVAVTEDAFILTNDGSAQTVLTNVLEILSLIPSGSVVYHNGKTSSWLIDRATSPNGIILDREHKHLIVSHVNDKMLSVYRIEKDYLSLFKIVDVPLMTIADNLYMDKYGAVWTGAHPIMKELFGHVSNCEDLSKYAPSQVLRIKFSEDFKTWEITEPFMDDGRLISASSIAVPFKNQLLIGSVCRQLVHCDITPETS
ncbi:hypothetical protein RB195_008034 [Necator americanus]